MATNAEFALRLPPALMEEVEVLAVEEAVSVQEFLIRATAERVAADKEHRYLDGRHKRAISGDFGRLLAKAGSATRIVGDELPEGWPGSAA